jgi:cytochrome c oxidase subunit I+III
MSEPRLLDLSGLPSYKYGHHSLMWWGLMGMIAIEGMAFALMVGAYFYLWSQAPQWPLKEAPPDLRWGTLNIVLLLASVWPNHWVKRAGEDGDNRRIRIGLVVGSLFGLALIGIRALEFTTLNCRWDDDAYASAVWLLLGLHTLHLVTDVFDTIVLAVLFLCGRPIEGKRHVDVAENAMYWYFVVYTWVPIYLVLYWVPRLPSRTGPPSSSRPSPRSPARPSAMRS